MRDGARWTGASLLVEQAEALSAAAMMATAVIGRRGIRYPVQGKKFRERYRHSPKARKQSLCPWKKFVSGAALFSHGTEMCPYGNRPQGNPDGPLEPSRLNRYILLT